MARGLIRLLAVLSNITCGICGGRAVSNGRGYVCTNCGNEM